MFYSSKPVNLMTHQAYHNVVKYLNIWLNLAIFGQIYLKLVSIVVYTTLTPWGWSRVHEWWQEKTKCCVITWRETTVVTIPIFFGIRIGIYWHCSGSNYGSTMVSDPLLELNLFSEPASRMKLDPSFVFRSCPRFLLFGPTLFICSPLHLEHMTC